MTHSAHNGAAKQAAAPHGSVGSKAFPRRREDAGRRIDETGCQRNGVSRLGSAVTGGPRLTQPDMVARPLGHRGVTALKHALCPDGGHYSDAMEIVLRI